VQRPADGAAKLIQIELLRGGSEVAFGIEIGVARKLEERAVNVVGAGFCGDEHRRSGARAVFRRVGVGENLELLNVVDRRENADATRSQFVVVDAIEKPVGAVGTRAAYREREGTTRGHLAVTAGSEKAVGVGLGRRAGGEGRELNEIASIQRQLRYLLRGDDLTERRIGCLDNYGVACYCNGSDYRGRCERKIEFACFVDLQMEIFGCSALKARRVDVHGVGADR
jgi:hypothetical protein